MLNSVIPNIDMVLPNTITANVVLPSHRRTFRGSPCQFFLCLYRLLLSLKQFFCKDKFFHFNDQHFTEKFLQISLYNLHYSLLRGEHPVDVGRLVKSSVAGIEEWRHGSPVCEIVNLLVVEPSPQI